MSPSSLRQIVFISVVTTLLVLLTLYLGYRIRTRFHLNGQFQWVLWMSLAFFIAIQVIGPLMYKTSSFHSQRPFFLQWITYASLGLFSTLIFVTICSDLILFFWDKFREVPHDSKRRLFFMVGGLSVGSVLVGAFQALRGPQIYKVDVPIPDLPEDLEGLRIVQISDLHVGPLIDKEYAQKVVDLANAQNPDIIAVTGDMVDGIIEQLENHVLPLAQLRATYGVYYCTGNHEYYWGAKEWVQKFKSLGFIPLMNEHETLTIGKSSVAIGGVTDLQGAMFYPDHLCSPKKAFEGVPKNHFKILLAHQPDTYKRIEGLNVDLQLSGHTHGGQFYPWKWVVQAVQRYYVGLNRHKDETWIYVNRGSGFWGPPHRLGVPSEVSVLQLVRARNKG